MSGFRNQTDGSRAARFLLIRDAFLSQPRRARPVRPGISEIAIGPFLIMYAAPGALPGRPFNMQIWPTGAEQYGQILQGDKVANVDWDQNDNVDLISFRSGEWEQQLLELLAASDTIEFLPRSG